MIGFYSYTVILTYLSLVFAMVGIHLSVIGVYQWSFICLMMCGICDTFDGMVARSKKNRTEEEKKILWEAKAVLMERNHMTEEEAHRYIQKCSMDSGTSLTETAQMVLSMIKL
mgnify:FL=1